MTFATAAPRIAKLIPLLGSDQPGEVIAAAAGIGRTLEAHSSDWFDLQDCVGGARACKGQRSTPRPAGPAPRWSTMPDYERARWLHLLDSVADELSSYERSFLDKLADLVHRPPLRLTPKQVGLLDFMIAAAWRRGHRI